ncbi:hypothetical protein TNCV_3836991 [Trichonephila clavipes]|nr:hypothetical protein TNCV_3836991 [Trichonephila clavipes]
MEPSQIVLSPVWCSKLRITAGVHLFLFHYEFHRPRSDPVRQVRGCGSPVIKVIGSWQACHEFEASTYKDPLCRRAMHVKSVERSNVLMLVWSGSWVRVGVSAQVSSSSLDHGSKLRGPSPKALA